MELRRREMRHVSTDSHTLLYISYLRRINFVTDTIIHKNSVDRIRNEWRKTMNFINDIQNFVQICNEVRLS